MLPHAPDAWVDYGKTKVGYELPVNRHFYVYEPPRPLDQIEADIIRIEGEIAGFAEGVGGMSYFARSDELPEWAAPIPAGWCSNWLKWSVDLCTKRPTAEEQEVLPYISNEDIASWTGQLLIEEPKPAEADSRKFQEKRCSFQQAPPVPCQGLPCGIRGSKFRRVALLAAIACGWPAIPLLPTRVQRLHRYDQCGDFRGQDASRGLGDCRSSTATSAPAGHPAADFPVPG